jgi:hypothetical protein
VEQIIEFQAAREYEGKGAFPDYEGPEHAVAMRRAAAAPGVKGAWIWNFGGGWGGPRAWRMIHRWTHARWRKNGPDGSSAKRQQARSPRC